MKKKNQNDVSCMACLNKAPGVLILSLLIALFSILSLQTNVMAQPTKTIKGKVISKSGEMLPGVSIVVKGTTTGTITDIDGNYTLSNVKPNSTLVYSFIGFTSTEVQVTNQSTIDITLQEDTKQIEEVVAIGYGVAKKRDLTGAVTQVKTEQLQNEKPQTVQDILRGNVAGMAVGYQSLAKGGGDMEIRGDNTLKTASNPLIVLDGVIYQGGMEDINPNDIETVDVLKDASSSAVYGARASNGVVIVTTKKGKQGKPMINVNSSVGLATMATLQKVHDPYDFMNWRTDVMKSLNYYNTATNTKLYKFDNPTSLPSGITETQWRDGSTGELNDIWMTRLGLLPVEQKNYKANTPVNWNDLVFQNGFRQDHNLSLSGKKDEVTYYWSLGYNKNEGIIVGDEFTTIRSRLNLDANVTKWFSVGLNTQFANRNESNINADWPQIWNSSPWGSIYKDDGVTIRESPVDDLGRGSKYPLYDKIFTERRKVYNTLTTNIYGKVTLPLGITYQLNYAPRYQWMDYMNQRSALHEEWALFGGDATRQQSSIFSWQLDNLIKWNKKFNEVHQFDVTLLANAEKYQSWDNTMSTAGFSPTDALGYHNMTAGKSTSNSISSNDEYSTGDALMARVFYSYSNKYMVTVSVRRDGYSAFGLQNPRGTFPSMALGWVMSDENFFKNNILTYAKLRMSYGENGNREVGRYDALSAMNIGKYPYMSLAGSIYESNQLYVNRMANPNLKWERGRALNFGLDFAIKKGVLDGSIEYYKMNTLDLLVDRKLPDLVGFASVATNLGELENKGVEFTLNARIMDHENFKWRGSFNISYNKNFIVHLYGDMVDVKDAQGNVTGKTEGDDTTNKWFIGHSNSVIWEPKIIGVWQKGQEADAIKYGQYPGDFHLEADGKINILDNQFQGDQTPVYRWNLRQEFNIYKNFDLSLSFYSNGGHKGTYNVAKNRDGFPERVNAYITPYWTPENPINNAARIYSNEGGAVFNVWRNRTFVRFDNISLSYSVPSKLLKKIDVANLKVFGTVRNVAVWSKEWKFWDPEQYRNPFDNDNLTNGPSPRTFTLGINLTL
jgi:TonB-linked SusC/RagA family outer membrane protein